MQLETTSTVDSIPKFISRHYADLAAEFRPSTHPFFKNLALRDRPNLEMLNGFYLNYQGAMHATREMVFHVRPGNPRLRGVLARIIMEDDVPEEGCSTHHDQLANMFRRMGSAIPDNDTRFDDLEGVLLPLLDEGVQPFVRTVIRLYQGRIGAFVVTEFLSDNWLHALHDGLIGHFPQISKEPYLHDIFENGTELKHARLSMEMLAQQIEARPKLWPATQEDSREMAQALWDLWGAFDHLLAS